MANHIVEQLIRETKRRGKVEDLIDGVFVKGILKDDRMLVAFVIPSARENTTSKMIKLAIERRGARIISYEKGGIVDTGHITHHGWAVTAQIPSSD